MTTAWSLPSAPSATLPSQSGRRGERPCFTAARVSGDRQAEILAIPGVRREPGGFACTWDVAWAVAALAGAEPPVLPLTDPTEQARVIQAMPGLERYRALGLPGRLRSYQKEDVARLVLWHWGFLANPPRSGKTPTAIAAAELLGAKKILCVVPALPKLGWAHEIADFAQEEAIILYGRAGKVARVFCRTCMGQGFDADGRACPSCRLLNGQSNGLRLIDAGHGTCTKHEVTCPKCAEELHVAIDRARYVIVNYELIVSQQAKDAAGGKYIRSDLLGWVPHLTRYHFDICIADEAHLLRGRNTDDTRRGQTRREKFIQLSDPIDRVWLLGGTPQFSFVADWWGQLDAASKGAATSWNDQRLFFDFDRRYCDGRKGEYGWECHGTTPYAETELSRRIRYFTIMRARSDILPHMPRKQRQVIRLEAETNLTGIRRVLRGKLDVVGKTKKLMMLTAKLKIPAVLENLLPELIAGQKSMVVCFNPDTARAAGEAITHAIKSRENRRRLEQTNARVWVAHGDGISVDARFNMGKAFREHMGAGVFVMTIDSFQVGVSLRGATTEHWIDVHHDPSAMLQAEDRPFEPDPITGLFDERGLSIIYYAVKGTIDEHRIATVLPKVDALARVTGEEGAVSLRRSMTSTEEKETMAETLARLAGHIGDDWSAPDDTRAEDDSDA